MGINRIDRLLWCGYTKRKGKKLPLIGKVFGKNKEEYE